MVLGCTKNTVVPREPLRGALSMILKPFVLHVVEGLLNIGHAQRHVRQAAAAAVLFDLFGHRRFRRQRLQQLHQVGTVAHLEQHFAHLVVAQHVFAVHFVKPIAWYASTCASSSPGFTETAT